MLRLLIFLICISPGLLIPQSSSYSGQVFTIEDGKEEALIGATVRGPGCVDIFSTDIEGKFTIEILDSIPPIVFVNYGCSIDEEPAFLLIKGIENPIEIKYRGKRYHKRRKRKLKELWQNAGLDAELF